MGASFDSRDDWDAYVGDIFQHLNAFVVNLAPNAGIGDIAERGPIDISNELPTCTQANNSPSLTWHHEPETRPSYRNARLVVDELERVDLGKMNLQLIANEENQDRTQGGKNEPGGMVLFVFRA